jgi:hypothetical protein
MNRRSVNWLASVAWAALALSASVLIKQQVHAAQPLFTCPQEWGDYTLPGAVCHCPGEESCSLLVNVANLAQPYACGLCRWSYSWAVECPGSCATEADIGTVRTECDPHVKYQATIDVPCPVTGSPWFILEFSCAVCE